VGVYSVISYLVRQRTHELGIRMALGASRFTIVMTNLREGLILVLVGIPIGLCGALFASGFLRSLLFGVGATDPATFICVPLLLLAAALLASYIPAWQASRIDPAIALRQTE
jgi:ABC-type antimicrobial peptide transport system permease subunit